MRTFFLRFIAALCMLVTALPVFAASRKQPLSLDAKEWTKANLGVSLRLPKGWKEQPGGELGAMLQVQGITLVTFANPKFDAVSGTKNKVPFSRRAQAIVAIVIAPSSIAGATLAEAVAKEKASFAQNQKKLLKEQKVTVSGEEGRALDLLWTFAGQRSRQVMVVRSGKGYSFVVQSLEESWKQYEKIFMQVIGSIQWSGDKNAAASAAPQVQHVAIKNFSFGPATVTVKRGSIVHFMNEDSAAHTVTAVDHRFSGSDTLNPGGTFSLNTATLAPGTYEYFCNFHSSMKGTIIVQ